MLYAFMAKPRRVLIATPLKGDLPAAYFKTSLQMATAAIPDVKLDWVILEGPAVQMARNEIVAYAREQKFDELVFWDKDVLAEQHGQNVTPNAFMRLLGHDVDIVCAPYSSRHLETHWHVITIDGEEPNKDGLQKVSRACIGFSKIKLSVFDKIEADNPDRKGVLIDPNKSPKPCTEFFPMGLQGKNTPESRISHIRSILANADLSASAKLQQIEREANLKYDEPSLFIGEDYWWCDLAVKSGFSIYLDTHLVMGHSGKTTLPIPTLKLFDLMQEPWRQEEIRAIKQAVLKKQQEAAIAQA
mgnify:CR=1 FL=1